MHTIWHDSNYDLAYWILKHSSLDPYDVVIKQLPKTNTHRALSNHIDSSADCAIIPLIKYEHPDIILTHDADVLCVLEFMTHTPQWHHPLQRFARIYAAAHMRVPSCLILPYKKTKLERKNDSYVPVSYNIGANTYHLFNLTTKLTKTPTQLFEWPTVNGYLKIDQLHPSAPFSPDIRDLIDFVNRCISRSIQPTITNTKFSPANIERVSIMTTSNLITAHGIPSTFHACLKHHDSCVFHPTGLSSPSSYFRTDPYAGMLCAFDMFYCRDISNNTRTKNLVFIAQNISLHHLCSQNKFLPQHDHDLDNCPFLHAILDTHIALQHVRGNCPYVASKQERIYGQVSDLIIFDDECYGGS